MNWLQKIMTPRARTEATGNAGKGKVPEGVWEKCGGCGSDEHETEDCLHSN